MPSGKESNLTPSAHPAGSAARPHQVTAEHYLQERSNSLDVIGIIVPQNDVPDRAVGTHNGAPAFAYSAAIVLAVGFWLRLASTNPSYPFAAISAHFLPPTPSAPR